MAFFFSGDEAHRTYLITRYEDIPAYRSFATRLKRLAALKDAATLRGNPSPGERLFRLAL